MQPQSYTSDFNWGPLPNFFSVSLNFMCQLWFTLLFTNVLPGDLKFLGRNVQRALSTSWATYGGWLESTLVESCPAKPQLSIWSTENWFLRRVRESSHPYYL